MEPYQPINCNYYDIIEGLATTRVPSSIEYRDDAGAVRTVRGIITNLYVREGVEYIEVDGKEIARLDKLLNINKIDVPGSC